MIDLLIWAGIGLLISLLTVFVVVLIFALIVKGGGAT